MEFVTHDPTLSGVPLGQFVPPPQADPTFGQVVGAAFQNENDVYNYLDRKLRPVYPVDESFDILDALENEPLADQFASQLARAQSPAEFNAIRGRIQEEERNRAILATAGFGGFMAAGVAGIVSPTSLIPMMGPARGLKGLAQATALAAGTVTAQEALLFNVQETRTLEEVAFGIAGGTVLGGLLGGAARYLSPNEVNALEARMVRSQSDATILRSADNGALEELELGRAARATVDVDAAFLRQVADLPAVSDVAPEQALSLARSADDDAALPSADLVVLRELQSAGVILEPEDVIILREALATLDDPKQLAPVIEEFVSTRLPDDATQQALEAGTVPSSSVGAARVGPQNIRIKRAETYVGKAIDRAAEWAEGKGIPVIPKVVRTMNDPIGVLAKLNPLTRQLENRFSTSARGWAATLQLPGIRLEGPAVAQAGDVVSRSDVHMSAVADFIVKYDEAFSEYITDGRGSKAVQESYAALIKAGLRKPREGLMTFREFEETVFRLGNTAEEVDDPAVMKAVQAQREYYEYVNTKAQDYYEQRRAVDGEDATPLYEELEFAEGDDIQAYVHHLFDPSAMDELGPQFRQEMADYGEGLMRGSFARAYNRYQKQVTKLRTQETILGLDEAQLNEFVERQQASIAELQLEFGGAIEQVQNLRKAMAQADEDPIAIKEAVKQLEESFGPEYAAATAEIKNAQTVIRQARAAGAGLTEQQADTLAKIDRLDELQIRELERLTSTGARLRKRMERLTEAEIRGDADIARLMQSVIRIGEKIAKHSRDANKLDAVDSLERAAKNSASFDRFMTRLTKLRNKDYAAMRNLLDSELAVALLRTQELNSKRAVRANDLLEKAKQLDPEARSAYRASELADVRVRLADLEDNFDTTWRDKGATGNPTKGDVDFRDQAVEDAQQLYENIVGNPLRVSGLNLVGGKRGAELRRMLTLPFAQKQKYLNRRPEHVIRAHAYSMFPDLELYRATGSVNGQKIFDDLRQDYLRQQVKNDLLPADARAAANRKLDDEYSAAQRDFQVLIDRLRHTRGRPANANGFGYRAGRVAMAVNTYRFMGMVMVSSFPDFARPVFRYGLTKTFRQAWLPMITDTARIKATRAEAARSGIALDPLFHNRSAAIFDIMENYASRQTLLERGAEFAANKTGFIALFDRYTAGMKHLATNIEYAEMSHALRVASNRNDFSAAEVKSALTKLARDNIGDEMAARIWAQYERAGGSTEFKGGFRLPNTEAWNDTEASMALRAAVNKVTNDLIVTPALDRPSWVDENMAYRLVAQFRSFTFTATNRILMSGLQEPDMVYLQGVLFSVALGALSYYTWAASVGGRAYEEMQTLDMDQWIYEAVGRSGVLGILSEGQRIGEQIPGLNDLAIFGANESQSRRATSIMGSIFGPSYDLSERLANIALGASDPTQATVRDLRSILVPWNNSVGLRRMFDAIEEAGNEALGIPERRDE